VESASCYVAECRDPARDAKIALTAEGLYGLFIYAGTAIVFVAVLGASLKSADPLTGYTNLAAAIFGKGSWVQYAIGIPLIAALMLSVLNAIMGCGRSLFQASEDRLLPKFFTHQNKHHAPDLSMLFNLVCALLVALLGSPVRIYIFSNVGYLFAIIVALLGYFFVRQFRKDQVSPFRLPGVFRWIALAMGAFLAFVYVAGGWGAPDIVVGSGQGPLLFILGLVVLGTYWPLYLWRRRTDRRDGLAPLDSLPGVPEEAGADESVEIKVPAVLDPAQG
jgi:amino acid transporter